MGYEDCYMRFAIPINDNCLIDFLKNDYQIKNDGDIGLFVLLKNGNNNCMIIEKLPDDIKKDLKKRIGDYRKTLYNTGFKIK